VVTGYSFPDFASGYLTVPDVLTHAECDDFIRALADLKRGRAGVRHLMRNAPVAALAADQRLLDIARQLLRAPAIPFRATLFEKSGKANWLVTWHQDTALSLTARFDGPGWGPWSEKAGILYAHAPAWALSRILALRIHLDASSSENGPLRVIPGSHAAGVLTDAQVLDHARANTPFECLVLRGGALAMSPMIIHSSSKARTESPRRVLHIEYADSLDLAPGVRLAVA
jgi:ectoine hydroxylase-related dioxygenase (phytanoyl-CoA dioxygenase family)